MESGLGEASAAAGKDRKIGCGGGQRPRRSTRLLWLEHATRPHGLLTLDDGAVRALVERVQKDFPVATHAVHDPGNPLADADGMVRYPEMDLVDEMTALMTASRGYEANVRAFNLLRGMVVKAFEIGAK